MEAVVLTLGYCLPEQVPPGPGCLWGALRALAPCGNHRCMVLFHAVHMQVCAVSCPKAGQELPLQVRAG